MENKLPARKPNRLLKFDYSSRGSYFVTICAAERKNHFWREDLPFDASFECIEDIQYSIVGRVVLDCINDISTRYPMVKVEHYVVMPDHVHMMIEIEKVIDEGGRPMVAPTISRVVQQFKGSVTKRAGKAVWQKLFYDHVIRNEDDYREHVKYILENPKRRSKSPL